ncbi:MAG: NTP transferase domain-containing protein [Wenzhouxiangellaceae bacterium]
MKALILSAGQGRRLLPLTANTPKCLLPLNGRTALEWQIDHLMANGVNEIGVVVGYNARQVEDQLLARYGEGGVQTIFNPFYEVADNLASCWMARHWFEGEMLLINGDTLFEQALLQKVLTAPDHPITVTIDRKQGYDADDMKVRLDGQRLQRIGKDLPMDQVDGESIGMLLFRDSGSALFRQTVEDALRQPESLRRWYLSVIDQLAPGGQVQVHSIEGLEWGEVDFPLDYEKAKRLTAGWLEKGANLAGCSA